MAFPELPENNPGISSEINQAVISQTTPQGFVEDPNAVGPQGLQRDPYSDQLIQNLNDQYGVAPIGPQGGALYPGLGHNINVGSVSGSQIGAGNIYVPGGNIAARDPVLARRKAIDDAAKARAAAIKPFDYGDPYKLKDARFQQKFQDTYYNRANTLIAEAKKKYGKDFGTILKDKSTVEGAQFVQEMANYEVLGREFDQITDLIADMDIGLQDKTKEYTPETLKLKREFENLVGNFEDGDIFNSKDLGSLYNKLKGHRSFENYIQDGQFLNQISGISKQFSYDKDKGEYYKVGTTETVKFGDAIKEVVDSLESTVFSNEIAEGVYDREYMEKAIKARLKDSIKQTGTITKKAKENIGGEAYAEDGLSLSDDKPSTVNFLDYNEDGTLAPTSTNYDSFYEYDFNTASSGSKVLVIDDLKVTNKGVEQTLQGSNRVQFTGFSTVKYTDADGKERVKVITRAKIESTVKQPYDGEGNKITMEAFKDLQKEDKLKGAYLTEERVQIDKPVDLTDHVFEQMITDMNSEDVEKLRKGRAGAFKRKKELQGSDNVEDPKGDSFN